MKNMIVAGMMMLTPFASEAMEVEMTKTFDVQEHEAKSVKSRRKAREKEEKKNKKRGPAGPAGAQGVDVTATGYIHQYSEGEQSIPGPSNSFYPVFFEVAGTSDSTWEYDPSTAEFRNQASGVYSVEYRVNVHGPAGQNTNPPSHLPEGPIGIGPSFEFVASIDGVGVPGSRAGAALKGSGTDTQQVVGSFLLSYTAGTALKIQWAASYGPQGMYSIAPVNYSNTGPASSAELKITRIK